MTEMPHHIYKVMIAVTATASLVATSCNKNVFDEGKYKEIVDILSPVDSVDSHHTWKLSTVHKLQITADTQSGVKGVLILSGDPSTQNADILTRTELTDGQTVSISFSAPTLASSFVTALLHADGTYTLQPFSTGQATLTMTDNQLPVSIYRQLTPQTFTYGYDDSYPLPEDFDYNDVVLRIAHERTGPKQVSISVTLAAVGTNKQIAAAIHLAGYQFTDIESVKAVDGKAFRNDIPGQSFRIINSDDLLISGRQGEAVINLFEDAHWSMGDVVSTDYGILQRKYYNVSSSTSGDYQQIATRTYTYQVNFKDGKNLNDFTFANLDPFTIEDYNGSFWEVHTYEFQQAQIRYEYPASEIKNLPWALEIPDGTFRYPLQGRNMGFIKDGITFGAYMTNGHSFGEWAENRLQATDWYHYPTGNMVY